MFLIVIKYWLSVCRRFDIMMLSPWLVSILILLFTITILIYKYLTRNKNYWKIRNVEYLEPSFLLGNLSDVLFLRKTFGGWIKDIYSRMSGPFFGIFLFDEPGLMVRSPEIIKDILVKDFNHFTDRSVAHPEHNEIVRNMMFFQRGQEWKTLRNRLSPVFTSGKLKGMTPILNEYGLKLVQRLKKQPEAVDVKQICSDYIADGVTKCFFGIESYSQEDTDSEFKAMLKATFTVPLRIVWSRLCYFFYPKLVNLLKLEFGEQEQLNYFCDAFLKAIKAREETNVRVNDFIDIINDMRKDEEFAKEYNFTGRGALAQPFMFFIAAQGTTASVLTFLLYEISQSIEIQENLHDEILRAIKQHGGITYDALVSMKYMEMCIQEALRKYPTLSFLDRRCNKEYTIRNSNVVIPEGQHVYIPVLGLHHDRKYFPDPEKFIPERFSDKSTINVNGIHYMPFGEGPRACLGERFGILNTKMALTHILGNFMVKPLLDQPNELILDPMAFTVDVKPGTLKLTFKLRQRL